MAWRSVQVAVAVAVVVVPFAYAVSGAQHDVLMAAGCGLAVGIGISLRTRERIGRSAGILVGTAVGMVAALEARRLVEQMARCVKFAGSAWLLTTPTGSRSSDDAAVRELRIAEAYACSHTYDSDHLA